MTELKLNETPVRTCRNFNINNIKIKDFKALEKQEKFENIEINGLNENANVSYTIVDFGGKHSITNYYSNLIRHFS